MTAKRAYTMSEAALQQRRDAAQHSTGPVTEEGKAISSRNNWRHGLYSEAAQRNLTLVAGQPVIFGKPCLSTCPKHPDQNPHSPCPLVEAGHTRAGGDCLDKEVYVRTFDALMRGMLAGELDDLHSILAANVAAAMEVLLQLRDEIATHGVVRSLPLVNKLGRVVYDKNGEMVPGKLMANPALSHYIFMLDKLGLSLTDLLATPRAAHHAKTDEGKADVLQEFLGAALGAGVGQRSTEPIDGELAG